MKRTVTIEIQAEIGAFETFEGDVRTAIKVDPPLSDEHPACPAAVLGSFIQNKINSFYETCRNPIPFGRAMVVFPVTMSSELVQAAIKAGHYLEVLKAVMGAPGEGFVPDQVFIRSAAQHLETCWRCVAPALHERILRDWLKMVGVEVIA